MRDQSGAGNEQEFQRLLQSSVSDIVKQQKSAGITVPNDGEFGKSMGQRVNYRAWLNYIYHRLDGLEIPPPGRTEPPPRKARPG